MCYKSRQTSLYVANLVAMIFAIVLLIYGSLLLHVLLRSYGLYEPLLEPPTYLRVRQPGEYIHPPADPLQSNVLYPRPEFGLLDRIRAWFSSEDYNNLDGQNVFSRPRARRQIWSNSPPRFQHPYYSQTGTGPELYPPDLMGFGERPDLLERSPLPYPQLPMNGAFRNRTFNLALAVTCGASLAILVHLLIFGAFAMRQQHSDAATLTLKVGSILSFFCVIAATCLGLHTALGQTATINAQHQQLFALYRLYDHNNPRQMATHFIDELQVALDCCGSTRPAELVAPTLGSASAAQLPRSCCARDRNELIALRAPLFEPPLADQPIRRPASILGGSVSNTWLPGSVLLGGPFSGSVVGECDLRSLPESNNRGCLPLVRELIITWFNWMLLYALIVFLLYLYIGFSCWTLAVEESSFQASSF